MRTLALTDEQAKWLERHLENVSSDRYWRGLRLTGSDDADEHIEAIKAKLERELERGKW